MTGDTHSIWDGIWPFSSSTTFGGNEPHLHQSTRRGFDPISHVLVPIQTNANVSAEHKSCLQSFFVLENKTAKAESTVSLFREDGLISWRDIKPE